jgi:hypothetical protein
MVSCGTMGLVDEEATARGGINLVVTRELLLTERHGLGGDMQYKNIPRNRTSAVLESSRVLTVDSAPETGMI